MGNSLRKIDPNRALRLAIAPVIPYRRRQDKRAPSAPRIERRPMTSTQSALTHLQCSMTGEIVSADIAQGLSPAGKPLLARYDLAGLKARWDRDALSARPLDLWRYRELLPVRQVENIVSLGEIATPLVDLPAAARRLGHRGRLCAKDESRLPTGSFKARGLAMAISKAKEFGLKRVAIPTNGNAGAAMAAYAARAGIEAYVFCPTETPAINVQETALQGAKVWRVNGLIHEIGAMVRQQREAAGWFDVSTLKEPYRIEGKKTMGLELAEQGGWRLPDAILYPTGGGTGLIGMWKAFAELEALGWIGPARPKMIAVQSTGCAPIVKAFDDGTEHAAAWPNAATLASGIRVPVAIGDFLILRAVRESGGFAIAVEDAAIEAWRARIAAEDGLLLCPEGAACAAAAEVAISDGRLARDSDIVLYNCGSGLKYPMPDPARRLDLAAPFDLSAILRPN